MRKPNEAYLEKAKKLKKEEIERLLARTRTKFMRRIEDLEMSAIEVAAIQLEIEDEELAEWREKWAEIQVKAQTKAPAKAQTKAPAKEPAKEPAKKPAKAPAEVPTKPATKPKSK